MRFNFILEDKRIDYELDMFTGAIKVFVNGYLYSKDFMCFGGKKTTYFIINNKNVCILINQPTFFALFRNKTFEVYINNQLYLVFDKIGNLIYEYPLIC